MTKVGAFLAGFGSAAAVAAGLWFAAFAPRWREHEDRAAAAERLSLRAKRDAADAQGYAESEHRLKLEMETELNELRRTMSAAPPKAGRVPGHGQPKPPGADLSPEDWDGRKLRLEIELLSLDPRAVMASPRYPLVVRSLKARGDESLNLLATVLASELPPEMKSVCATLLGALDDPRGVAPLLAAWPKSAEPNFHSAVLRGLANLPGDEQTPVLVGVWNDPAAEAMPRLLAIHGLARRRHEIALAVVSGGAPGATPPHRMQALKTLHEVAMGGGWKDAALLPLFGKALRSADGDAQRKVALLAIEGFWSKDSLPDLEEFAESAGGSELAVRARRAADGISSGKPRPEGAGVPAARPGAGSPEPAEPSDPVPEKRDTAPPRRPDDPAPPK